MIGLGIFTAVMYTAICGIFAYKFHKQDKDLDALRKSAPKRKD